MDKPLEPKPWTPFVLAGYEIQFHPMYGSTQIRDADTRYVKCTMTTSGEYTEHSGKMPASTRVQMFDFHQLELQAFRASQLKSKPA